MASRRYIPEFIILQLFFAVSQLAKEGVTTTPFIPVMVSTVVPARIFHELLSRGHEDRRATHSAGACAAYRATVPRYRGIGSEAYLNGTSQGELVLSVAEGTPEDARKDGHIRGRSK